MRACSLARLIVESTEAIAAVTGPALLGALVATDGRSNWFKGVQLLAVYAPLALVCYLVPAS